LRHGLADAFLYFNLNIRTAAPASALALTTFIASALALTTFIASALACTGGFETLPFSFTSRFFRGIPECIE
jgi:hypothetical protein